jgi:DNA-binding MarR family transcriptional regulator
MPEWRAIMDEWIAGENLPDLIAAFGAVATGEIGPATRAQAPESARPLTPTETAVLAAMHAHPDATNTQLAELIGITPHALRQHLYNLRNKVDPYRPAHHGPAPAIDDLATLDAIQTYRRRHGYSPSIRDLAAETHHSTAGIRASLRRLHDQGHIQLIPNCARAIHISQRGINDQPPH